MAISAKSEISLQRKKGIRAGKVVLQVQPDEKNKKTGTPLFISIQTIVKK